MRASDPTPDAPRLHDPFQGPEREPDPKPAKVRATLYLPAELLDEARDAVVHLAGYPARMTLTKLAERAFRREIELLKRDHNAGKAFPRRTEDLKGGRPIAA